MAHLKRDAPEGNKTNESKLQSKELYGNKADYLLAHLEQELGKVDIDKPYNVRISNNEHGNNQHNVSNGIINQEESLQSKDSKHGYHNQSLMNFLKKSQENIATPACQTDNYPTNTRILYKNTNTRLTLPHQLKNPTYELPNNITNILSYPTHTYKYITDRSPYHNIYSISDATHKYNPSYITGPNMKIILQA